MPSANAAHALPVAAFRLHIAEPAGSQPLCLALCNTRHWRNSPAPRETLLDVDALLRWAVAHAVLAAPDAERMAVAAARDAHAAQAELRRTLELREAIASWFAAAARGRAPDETAQRRVLATVREALAGLALRFDDGALVPMLDPPQRAWNVPRWLAALSAFSLATATPDQRVRQCADDRGCGWLFVDTTRNGRRRFCFSNECGNRARQARYRSRHRGGAEPVEAEDANPIGRA